MRAESVLYFLNWYPRVDHVWRTCERQRTKMEIAIFLDGGGGGGGGGGDK